MNSNTHSSDEQKDPESIPQSIPQSMSPEGKATPLAVPMVADTNQQSVTRNDAKIITQCRLKRLKELSCRPEEQLSKDQKDEKKRIIRLEKNRRAAAMSRRKKKMYVKNLEQRAELMAKHLAILEMENNHLRAMLAFNSHNSHNNNSQFDASLNNNNKSDISNKSETNSPSNSNCNSVEARKVLADNPNNPNNVMSMPMQYPFPPRMMHYPLHSMPPPLAPLPPGMMLQNKYNNVNNTNNNQIIETKTEHIAKNIENAENEFPPSVFVPPTISDEYINNVSGEEDFEMSESVQECGSIDKYFENREYWDLPQKFI